MIVPVLKHIFNNNNNKKEMDNFRLSSRKAPFSFHSDLKWQRMPADGSTLRAMLTVC